jgi:hypothetical protein
MSITVLLSSRLQSTELGDLQLLQAVMWCFSDVAVSVLPKKPGGCDARCWGVLFTAAFARKCWLHLLLPVCASGRLRCGATAGDNAHRG